MPVNDEKPTEILNVTRTETKNKINKKIVNLIPEKNVKTKKMTTPQAEGPKSRNEIKEIQRISEKNQSHTKKN